jgi:hypothetical protein
VGRKHADRFDVPEIGPSKIPGMESSTQFIVDERFLAEEIFDSEKPNQMNVGQHEPGRDANDRQGMRGSRSKPELIPGKEEGSHRPLRSPSSGFLTILRYSRFTVPFLLPGVLDTTAGH